MRAMASLMEASRLATLLRRDADKGVSSLYSHIRTLARAREASEIADIAEFLYGHRVMGADRLMSIVGRCVGVFGEEWDELLSSVVQAGNPLVPLLASESPVRPKWPLRLTIPEATLLLYDLQKRDEEARVVETIFTRVGREEATLLWARVLGEYPPISKGKFLRCIAKCSGYDPTRIREAARFHGIGAVVKSALEETLPKAHELTAGQHFTPAVYKRWVKWHPPYERTAYDLVEGARVFVHRSADGEWVYRRSGERWAIHPPVEGLCDCDEIVAEAEERDGRLVVMDTLHCTNKPQCWALSYAERTTNTRLIRDHSHLLSLVRNLPRSTTLRLIDADAAYFDSEGMGGYIAPDSLFEIPLLLTRVRTIDGEGEVCLSIMDGFDAEQVACIRCPPDILRVPRLQSYLTSRWVDVENLGVILVCLAFGYHDSVLVSPKIVRLDGSLGISDTIQKGDLLAISSE